MDLDYYRARWYNPTNGRFTSVDPVSGNSFTPISFHRYLYANSSPLSFSDPSGKATLAEVYEAIDVDAILNTLAKVVFTAEIVQLARDLPVRMNHYTTWETLDKIMSPTPSGGINNPAGDNYVTPDYYFDGIAARMALNLDKTPELFINLVIYPKSDGLIPDYPHAKRVPGNDMQPGGGLEYWTKKPIPFWTRFPVIVPLF